MSFNPELRARVELSPKANNLLPNPFASVTAFFDKKSVEGNYLCVEFFPEYKNGSEKINTVILEKLQKKGGELILTERSGLPLTVDVGDYTKAGAVIACLFKQRYLSRDEKKALDVHLQDLQQYGDYAASDPDERAVVEITIQPAVDAIMQVAKDSTRAQRWLNQMISSGKCSREAKAVSNNLSQLAAIYQSPRIVYRYFQKQPSLTERAIERIVWDSFVCYTQSKMVPQQAVEPIESSSLHFEMSRTFVTRFQTPQDKILEAIQKRFDYFESVPGAAERLIAGEHCLRPYTRATVVLNYPVTDERSVHMYLRVTKEGTIRCGPYQIHDLEAFLEKKAYLGPKFSFDVSQFEQLMQQPVFVPVPFICVESAADAMESLNEGDQACLLQLSDDPLLKDTGTRYIESDRELLVMQGYNWGTLLRYEGWQEQSMPNFAIFAKFIEGIKLLRPKSVLVCASPFKRKIFFMLYNEMSKLYGAIAGSGPF